MNDSSKIENLNPQEQEDLKRTESINVKPFAEQLSDEVLSLHAQLLNTVEQSVIATDLGGIVTYWNLYAEELYGWSAEEAIGRNIMELTTPRPSIRQADEIMTQLRQGKSWTGELIVQRKDGTSFPAQTTNSPIYDKQALIGIIGLTNDITERKLTEQALRVSEARYRSLLENANDIIYSHDLFGNYVAVNGAAEKITGYSLEELKKMNIAEFIVPEHHELIKQVIESKLRDPTPSVHEFDIITKDGHRRTLEVNPKVSSIEGEPLAIEGVARDVTERKRAEEKLRESEERFRRAFAIETVGVIFLKTDGQITDSNDAFLRMSGYDREDCKRGLLRWDRMTPPEFMPQTLKAVDEFLTLGRTVPYEKQYIRKDGSRWWALFAATRINAEEGVEFIIDITERKQTEGRLRESEERLRLATEAARMYSWEIDLTTQKVKFSENAVAAFNLDLLPKNFEEVMKIVHPEDREQSLREFERALSGTGTFTHQYRVINSAKKIIWLESYAVTVRDAQGNPVKLIGITQNITERKQMEEIRHSWAERLEAAREDERRSLSRQLHDDIVQQLAVASIKLQRLEKKLVELLPEENGVLADIVVTQELLHRNQRSLRQMAHKLHSGVLEHFGLVEAFRRLKTDVDNLFKEHSTTISLDLSLEVPRLELTVENGIYRIAQEAIINALKHAHAELISLSLGITDNLIFVIIRDDGCGFHLKEVEGNGIGLASMYERTELIGAKLDVTSQRGRGTIITLKVPLKENRRTGQFYKRTKLKRTLSFFP